MTRAFDSETRHLYQQSSLPTIIACVVMLCVGLIGGYFFGKSRNDGSPKKNAPEYVSNIDHDKVDASLVEDLQMVMGLDKRAKQMENTPLASQYRSLADRAREAYELRVQQWNKYKADKENLVNGGRP